MYKRQVYNFMAQNYEVDWVRVIYLLHMETEVRALLQHSEVKGKPGGNPEPGDQFRFIFVFGLRVACV